MSSISKIDTSQSPSHLKVYVVDDDPIYTQLLRIQLESVQLPVETFHSAREFLEVYDPTLSGCLILDLRMPEMSGLELLRLLTSHDDYLPVILLTAFADVPTTVEAMKNGAIDVLEKPHRAHQLIEKVQQALQQEEARYDRISSDADTIHCLNTLTPREKEVLDLIMEGSTAKQISRELGISVRTVDFHRRNLLDKMHIDNSVQLTRLIDEFKFRHSRSVHPR